MMQTLDRSQTIMLKSKKYSKNGLSGITFHQRSMAAGNEHFNMSASIGSRGGMLHKSQLMEGDDYDPDASKLGDDSFVGINDAGNKHEEPSFSAMLKLGGTITKNIQEKITHEQELRENLKEEEFDENIEVNYLFY